MGRKAAWSCEKMGIQGVGNFREIRKNLNDQDKELVFNVLSASG